MSSSITNAFIQSFKSGIFHAVQQKGSRLSPYVRQESQAAKVDFYDGLAKTDVSELTSRHADTQYVSQTHLRRACTLRDFVWADLIDNADKIRVLNDPTNAYSQNAIMAMMRKTDSLLIEAALGTAYSGETGTTANILPASQWVGATDNTIKTNLNTLTLRRIKDKFGIADVDDSERLVIVVSQSQITSLLGDTQVASVDYNSVKALVNGEIDTFMGFKFVRTQLLPTLGSGGFLAEITEATGAVTLVSGDGNNLRRCFAFAPSGIVLATGQNEEAKIDQLPGKNYSTQVFARMTRGAVRMEEEKVVGVICSEP